jgi:ketosteroid isomerase-like protein
MSRSNVEIVRRAVEHFRRTREPPCEDLDPEFEIHDYDIPDGGVYRGPDGWRKWIAQFGEVWESYTSESEEIIDAGDDHVVEVVRLSARGRHGITVERQDGIVYALRDGKLLRLDYYGSRAEALQAAGLREDPTSSESFESSSP